MSVQSEPHFSLNWRKSTYSADQGNCVEIAAYITCVLARDSNDHNGAVLEMTMAQWEQFLASIRK
jgi:hypothetical protein